MLADSPLATVIPCVDLARAREFYGNTLGLTELDIVMPEGPDGEPGGIGYQCGDNTMLFVYVRDVPTKAEHTVAAWMTNEFDAVVNDLLERGLKFEVYEGMPDTEWDARGVASLSGGFRIAYLKDPEGNILAIDEMPGRQ